MRFLFIIVFVMAIIKGDKVLNTALDSMLQVLAYWMGLRKAINDVVYEHDCVHEACSILRSLLGKDYRIKYEYAYTKLDKTCKSKKRADLVVLRKTENGESPICVMEFKMSSNTNSGVLSDVKKLSKISREDLTKLVILMYWNESKILRELYTEEEGIDIVAPSRPVLIPKDKGTYTVSVHRVAKARAAINNSKRSPYMAICIGIK